MSTGIKTEIRIPEIWFDFYSRLLPGCTFIFFFRGIIKEEWNYVKLIDFLLLVGMGYVIGLISHPLSSLIVGRVFEKERNRKDLDEDFLETVLNHVEYESKQAAVLSKMHGECVFFVQLFVLEVVFLAIYVFYFLIHKKSFDLTIIIICSGALVYFIFGAFNVAYRMTKKAISYLSSPIK